ncbi:acyl-CoA carboxylase subunit epsilon, partial [Streptomyces sp. SID2999]|nr:acyl-CoA carboxylase subunit epsilon [Streptomyces sp. SID2999]
DAWSDPARIAARRLPAPGPVSWSRTYWPGG